jgi:ABC-2 type transport system ATP-binding protein
MAFNIVEAEHLVKKYCDRAAVDDVSFTIEEGEIFGLLGPNGAGKSTAISMLTGLFPPTKGTARVGGHDVVRASKAVKQIIGVVPQELALYPTLSGRENVLFFGEMFGMGGKQLRARADEVLDFVAMSDRAGDPVSSFSGGMKRRINLAVGLINDPRILFLDEPTVGVDPQSRNHIFESVGRLNRERGMSILYTTHYMEEAERLCHRVGIIDQGRIIALDTPRALIDMLGGGIVQIGLPIADEDLLAAVLAQPAVKSADYVTADGNADSAGDGAIRTLLKIETEHANTALLQILQLFNQKDVTVLSMEILEPNLETVFLHLTGKSLRE